MMTKVLKIFDSIGIIFSHNYIFNKFLKKASLLKDKKIITSESDGLLFLIYYAYYKSQSSEFNIIETLNNHNISIKGRDKNFSSKKYLLEFNDAKSKILSNHFNIENHPLWLINKNVEDTKENIEEDGLSKLSNPKTVLPFSRDRIKAIYISEFGRRTFSTFIKDNAENLKIYLPIIGGIITITGGIISIIIKLFFS